MGSQKWTFDQALKYLQDGTLDLNDNTIMAALVTSAAAIGYSQWAASTAQSVGDIRVPTADNGRRYICTVAGTTGTTEPTWPVLSGNTVVDGGVTWQEFGGALCNRENWAGLSGAEIAAGNGYTTGGAILTGLTITVGTMQVDGRMHRVSAWSADALTWSALTATFRYLVLYASGTLNGVTNPLISYILMDDTPADYSVNGVDLTINWNASGIHAIYA